MRSPLKVAARLLAAAAVLLVNLAVLAAVSPPWDPFFATQVTVADVSVIAPVSTSSNRDFGIAAGDFDADGNADIVVGRTDGRVHFLKGNGDGTFAVPVQFAWKLETFNAWSFAAGDLNGDGKLDVVFSANAAGADAGGVTRVADGDVRVLLGIGNGTFATTNNYLRSGITFNAGTLLADVGTDAGSLAVGDVDGDGDQDIVVGAIDALNSVVKLLRNGGSGSLTFASETLISQATACAVPCSPIYYPASSTQNSPWGLALGDIDGDGDLDLWVGDRALYVYRFLNNGAGVLSLSPPSSPPLADRPNVYLRHDGYRAAVGYTPSLASADINGDGKADLVLGLHSGAQTPASGVAHDGELLLDASAGTGHTGLGALSDIGTAARGVALADMNGDTYLDIVAGNYEGQVKLLRQLPPLDTDEDGISDYLDNAPGTSNTPRLDMNADGSTNHRDQLDNDADTVLGDPETPATWIRLGDPDDPDDDNDLVNDATDNCPFVPNGLQADADADGVGDACDPLDNRDSDADGVPDGPAQSDPLYPLSRAAKIKWSRGTTHFVIRIDALGRFFQNEFTQIMTDAAVLSPSDWLVKCWENYQPGDFSPDYEPCGTDEGLPNQTLTLPGGKEVPVTLAVIPKQLWTDPPVVTWINDRNNSPLFELAQHGTYHVDNTPLGDWKNLPDRNYFSCELCGLTEAENFELMKVGFDTLAGTYANKWIAESGATAASPKIDWSSSAIPLLSFSPPYNTSDPEGRKAVARLGYKAFSASVFEEAGYPGFSEIFSPEGGHHEQFDQFGMFHVSADLQLNPPDTSGDSYDTAAYHEYLASKTNDGGLTTWLIEEVDWSGRPCPNSDRLGTCNGGSNREDNTVYLPRWNAWMQLLDFVKTYPGGVAMTMGEVALAFGHDNAPTVANPDQADSDNDGVGDVIDGASMLAATSSLTRNLPSTLSATLKNGAGDGIAAQSVVFSFDADGDGTEETYSGTTDANGIATASVTPTRPVGAATFTASWDGQLETATGSGIVSVGDMSRVFVDASNPATGQVTDAVTVGATLADSSNQPLAGRTLTFSIGVTSGAGVTDAAGHATAVLTLTGPAGAQMLQVQFAGDTSYGASSAFASFSVAAENTTLTLKDAVAGRKATAAVALATLTEADGVPLAGKSITFYVQDKVKGAVVYTAVGTVLTDGNGQASLTIPTRYISGSPRPIRAVFAGDGDFLGSTANANAYR